MSFLFCNADTGEIIDIVEDRKFETLKKYFIRFTPQARQSVKRIVIDMYPPYMKLIKELFPHAKILNKTRIQMMKQHKRDYHKLKNYWKFLLKPEADLNATDYYYTNCFKRKISHKEIVSFSGKQSSRKVFSTKVLWMMRFTVE